MDPDKPRILIGTLHCGENEFAACVESLRAQTFQNWEHFVLENLPNREAHETLYRQFMDRAGEFDLFLKLDADMILRDPAALEKIVARFREAPGLDQIEMTVFDIPSNTNIWGVHAFSNRARWEVGDDLFVDPKPKIPGSRLRVDSEPLVTHCADPSPAQAYLLGVHRALKVLQSGKTGLAFDPINAAFQWRYLKAVWRNFLSTREPRFGLCILGAEHVFIGQANANDYASKNVTRELPDSVDELQQLLKPNWIHNVPRELRFLKQVAARTPSAILARGVRKLTSSNR